MSAIYLDCAATSLVRPVCVGEAVAGALGAFGNPGRGACDESLAAARTIESCREKVLRLFGCDGAYRVCFTQNATQALNEAVYGLVKPGDHVVSTVLEHNSVLRPLNRMAQEPRARLAFAGCDQDGCLDYDDLESLIGEETRLVVCTAASNVTGECVDLARVARAAHASGALLVVDASQAAGCVPLNVPALGIDVLCFTGHKGLMGPTGTGGIVVRDGVEIAPLLEGGTGVHSFDPRQPLDWPVRLEAGTLNSHGIAGLGAGIDFLDGIGGPAAVHAHCAALAQALADALRPLPGIGVVGPQDRAQTCGIVSFSHAQMDSAEVADILLHDFGIATRAGAHCAPKLHEALGTQTQGLTRLSFGWFNTQTDIDQAIAAVREIAS